ncbi:hypothetical protein Afil01_51760 [Actinorhabdospora filicis]|uniref:Uncharacterized protein n=1 Tax=Actinorhabdospora filicis TaxID=1785913 RepID=A0A9W6SNZ5_9ACTN|nr:hypothetical protein [Actinorhabdospora filicis]GLZ80369.1 hypothetical protein Afil01_51760 [Actinorhabdospora filicis]
MAPKPIRRESADAVKIPANRWHRVEWGGDAVNGPALYHALFAATLQDVTPGSQIQIRTFHTADGGKSDRTTVERIATDGATFIDMSAAEELPEGAALGFELLVVDAAHSTVTLERVALTGYHW